MGCDCIISCFVFKKILVFRFSIDSLQNLTILLSLLPMLLTFPPSYGEHYQMLSGNQSRLYLNSCSFSCSPHILPLISLIDPCNVYFQGDILFALLVVSSALPNVWRFFWLLLTLLIRCCVGVFRQPLLVRLPSCLHIPPVL